MLGRRRGPAALLEQLPGARRPPPGPPGRGRCRRALRRRRRRVAADLGRHGAPRQARAAARRRSRARRRRSSSARATSRTPGRVAALAGEGEVVFSDELNHASIIDGCRLAKAETFVYRHRDTGASRLGPARGGRSRGADRHRRRLLDGRGRGAAPRPGRHSPRRHGCRLMVDEAHGTGAIGPGGRGTVAAAGLERRGRRDRGHARQGARRLRRLRLQRAPSSATC